MIILVCVVLLILFLTAATGGVDRGKKKRSYASKGNNKELYCRIISPR